jgi:hypothetical protein
MTLLVRRMLLWLTSLIGALVGFWAASAPRSFYDAFPGLGFGPWVAIDGAYNEYLVRMPPADAIGEVVSLSSTLVLAVPLLIGPRRGAAVPSTTVVAEGKASR